MLGMYFRVLRYFAFYLFCSWRKSKVEVRFSVSLISPIIIFSTEEKPKKRNEKECQSRSTELREVCQGLRWKYSFCGAIAEQKGRFSDATRRAWPLQTTETELSLHFIFISFDDKHNSKSIIISPRITCICTYLFFVWFFLNMLVQVEVKTSKP